MAYVKKAKRVARRVARGVYKGAKRRYVTKGGANIKNILSDVKLLKSLVNIEKKRVDVTQSLFSIGQFNGVSNSGGTCLNITPIIAQGITGSTRNGNSIKLISGCLDLNILQMASAINQMKIRYQIYVRPDNTINMNGATAYGNIYEPNPFSTVIDFYSARDPEHFQAFKLVKSGVITLSQDQITSGQANTQLRIPLKFNHHLKYNTNSSTDTTKNQFYIAFTCSSGDVALSTGAQFQYNMRWYFTDN